MQEERRMKHIWVPNTLPAAPGGLTTHPWKDTALGERAGSVHIGSSVTEEYNRLGLTKKKKEVATCDGTHL